MGLDGQVMSHEKEEEVEKLPTKEVDKPDFKLSSGKLMLEFLCVRFPIFAIQHI